MIVPTAATEGSETGRLAICLFEGRVAPRYDRSQVALFLDYKGRVPLVHNPVSVSHMDSHEICELIISRKAGTVVCGGIKGDCRIKLEDRGVRILDNVIGSSEKVIAEFLSGELACGRVLD